jgi:hypothetical protein
MPQLKENLIPMAMNHSVTAFDPTNYGGHGSTRYEDWLEQDASDLLEIECVKSNRYEPYMVFSYCREVPPFQQVFTGYGKNKMTWVMHLRRAGFRFWQVGESFVIHYPHLDSKAREAWNGGNKGHLLAKPKGDHVEWSKYKRGRVDQNFVEFRNWLQTVVPDESHVGMCDDAWDDDAKLWVDHVDVVLPEQDNKKIEVNI